jgi:hypothetical protein
MIKFKPNVLFGKKNYTYYALKILEAVEFTSPPGYTPTITSACDGKHSEHSLHYVGFAFDVRVKDYPENHSSFQGVMIMDTAESWEERLKQELGEDYDVVLHGEGNNRHIHIEYDPRI